MYSYELGYAAQYNGSDLVADSSNTVIVVIIQYRLGAFGTTPWLGGLHYRVSWSDSCIGFLSGNEIKAQGALNAGLREKKCYCFHPRLY